MTQDIASIVYTITGKRADGSAINLTKTQSFSKSKVGATGATGTDGERGPGRHSIGVTSLPTNSTTPSVNDAFEAAIGLPVDRDQAWFYTGTLANPTSQGVWLYDADVPVWIEQIEVIDGNLLVTGTVTANAIDADAITGKNVTVGNLTSTTVPTGTETGARIQSDGTLFVGNKAEYLRWNGSVLSIQGEIVNTNLLEFNGFKGRWLEITTATANFNLTSDMNFLGGAGLFAFMMVGGGGGGGKAQSSNSARKASGGGASGLANFVYDWNGSTALTFTRGTGGAPSTAAIGNNGTSSLFKIAGTTRATAAGGSGGSGGTLASYAGGAGGSATYSDASTYFPLYARSETGGTGGIASLGNSACGGGGIDAFNLGKTCDGGDDKTRGGSPFGTGNAVRYYRTAADYPFGSFLSVDWVNNGRDESAFAASGGIFAGGLGVYGTLSDFSNVTAGSGGFGGGGGAMVWGLADGTKQSGAGGNGVLYVRRL